MVNKVDKEMIDDSSIVEESELASTGTSGLPFSTFVISSVVGSTKTINISSGDFNDPRLQENDIIRIVSGLAIGSYSVDEIISDTVITVKQTILDAPSGGLEAFYRSGAELTGFDTTNSVFDPNIKTVQEALDSIKKNAVIKRNVSGDILIPAGHTSILNSTIFDGEMMIDGEGYII